jgi:AhpD family alkylhydroperoxidase
MNMSNTSARHHFMKRLIKPKDFKRLMADLMASAGDSRRQPRNQRISRQFSERIMMAVTEVNGCRYCSYFHTQVSLRAGIQKDEIQRILSGDFDGAPQDELAALYFAQHYAESGGRPNSDAVQCLRDAYGEAGAKEILAYIRTIMVGNAWGNMFDAFRVRLSGKPAENVTVWDEIGVIFGPLLMIPAILLGKAFGKDRMPIVSAD